MLFPCIVLSAFLSASNPYDADAAAALALHGARMRAAEVAQAEGYATMRARAIEGSIPLVIGVGCEPPAGAWLSVRWDKFPTKEENPCIIVAKPRKDGDPNLIWLTTLPASQSGDVARLLAHPGGLPVVEVSVSGGQAVTVAAPSRLVAQPVVQQYQPVIQYQPVTYRPAYSQPIFTSPGYCPPGGT